MLCHRWSVGHICVIVNSNGVFLLQQFITSHSVMILFMFMHRITRKVVDGLGEIFRLNSHWTNQIYHSNMTGPGYIYMGSNPISFKGCAVPPALPIFSFPDLHAPIVVARVTTDLTTQSMNNISLLVL